MPPDPATPSAPEQGQLVRVRNRLFLVKDAVAHESPTGQVLTRLELECLDDDRLAETVSVFWEREIHGEILRADTWPKPEGRWDRPDTFEAFLTAIRWSSTSVLRGGGLLSVFRGAIEMEPYQLEPAARAILAPRVNLLIADDVGLGKTIEAGLALQEMLARGRVRNCLVVCPASLQHQWQEEMAEKFDLEFRILDRDAILQLRREYGTHVNPWRSYPRLITSIDFLKRESVMAPFEASLDGGRAQTSWDLLILDEAHNCAPSGRRRYVRDSDRTHALRRIAPHFQHRLFLTATPHNGFTESFTALLAELDPLRFHRAPTVDPDQVAAVMVRRLKEQLQQAGEVRRPFPRRTVRAISVPDREAEREASDLLDRYIESRMARIGSRGERFAIEFALTLLRKRFLSSPLAFQRSLETHLEHVTRPGSAPAAPVDEALTKRLIDSTREDIDDDDQRDVREQEALRESTRFFGEVTAEEDRILARLSEISAHLAGENDAKLRALETWVREHLLTNGAPNRERLLLFTEYKDTLEYLEGHIGSWIGPEHLLRLTGGGLMSEREKIKSAFLASPEEHPVRVLLATDAAAEGLNLQNHCRYLIHYEIPWNPNRLEQRNGRIDRHGQPASEVFVHHFVHENRRDSEFLKIVVEKIERMREDLGAVAAVIEAGVERFMLGDRTINIEAVRPRKTLRDDLRRELWDRQRLRQLRDQIDAARREGNLYPETLRQVLDEGLRLEGHRGLEPAELRDSRSQSATLTAAKLTRTPEPWGERCHRSIHDAKGRLRTLVFDPEDAVDRADVALVHLDHPLMKRAIASFRRHLFAVGLGADERLHRATYRILPPAGGDSVILVAHIRLLAVGEAGQKLHEEVRRLAWRVREGRLIPLDPQDLALLPPGGTHDPIPVALGDRLRRLIEREEDNLRTALRGAADTERVRVQVELERRGDAEATALGDMIRTRRTEIQARIKEIRHDLRLGDTVQLPLDFGPDWDPIEADQLRHDVNLLERRLDQLREDLEREPQRVRDRYRLRSLQAFPLGLEFLLPRGVAERGELS